MTVSWCLLLSIGIIAVTIEQFIHLCRPDFVSKKARPLLTSDKVNVSSALLAFLFFSICTFANAQQFDSLCGSSQVIEKAREHLSKALFAEYRPNVTVAVSIISPGLDNVIVRSKEGVVNRTVICRADVNVTVNDRQERLTRTLIYEVNPATGEVTVPLSSVSKVENEFARRLKASSEKKSQDYAKNLCSDFNVFAEAQKQLSEHLTSEARSPRVSFSASNPTYEGRGRPPLGESGPSTVVCKSDITLTLNERSEFLGRFFTYYVIMDDTRKVTVN